MSKLDDNIITDRDSGLWITSISSYRDIVIMVFAYRSYKGPFM